MVAGLHVPVIPFDDVPGRAGATEFWHSGPIAAKVGVTEAVMVTDRVVGTAHWAGLPGVNV